MTTDVTVSGTCDPRFETVRDVFADNHARGYEIGSALCLYLDGTCMLDIWAGTTSPGGPAWERDTIVNFWSTTKGMAAICANMLVDRGELDLDAPVASYWPEFKAAGKETLPVRWLLSHQAGLPGLREPLEVRAFYDWDRMCALLAAEEPWWEPGTQHGYHAFTYGWLVGEVVRRISGVSLGTFFRTQVVEPLGVDLHIGLPASEHGRVAPVTNPPPVPPEENPLAAALIDPDSLAVRVLSNPPLVTSPLGFEIANEAAWREAEIPAANGHGNARGLARVYAALARGGEIDGVRLMSHATIEAASTAQARGMDAVLNTPRTWGLGFMLEQTSVVQVGDMGFGHPGAGGSIGYADPDKGLGFGYTMNRMIDDIPDPRLSRIIAATYEVL